MNAATEAKFKPFESPAARDFSDAKVATSEAAKDSNAPDKASFRDILLNSNDDTAKERVAQKNGDNLRMAKSDAEFAKMMADKANQGITRKPQNELDKDAFLKLFVTQMRNQDPLSPDNSSQMAAQLAQFHGLEQMMNVNKNLEKMQSDEALGRAVTLLNFVGKDIKLENGKLMVEGGKVSTDASFKLDSESVKTIMEVRDGAGVVVASRNLGHVPAGETKVEFNGVGKTGKPLGDGAYTFSIQATDMQNQPMNAPITSMLQVTGVDLHDGGGSFYTSVGKVGVKEVASVGTQGYNKLRAAPVAMPGEEAGPGVEPGAQMGAAGAAGAPPPVAAAQNPAAQGQQPQVQQQQAEQQQQAQAQSQQAQEGAEPKRAAATVNPAAYASGQGEHAAASLPKAQPANPAPQQAQVPPVKVEKPSPVPPKTDKLASTKAPRA